MHQLPQQLTQSPKFAILSFSPYIPHVSNQLAKVKGEKHLYRHGETGNYYLRKRGKDSDTNISLNTTRIRKACELRDAWVHNETNRALGIIAPEKKSRRLLVPTALDDYQTAGFPSERRGQLKYPGKRHLRTELDAVNKLKSYFKMSFVDELDQNELDKYHHWRKTTVNKGSGDRTCDLELNTLSKSFDWAVRKNNLDENPILRRSRYHSYLEARHCKSMSPTNAIDLHQVASVLFEDTKSESLGWQFLFESFFGVRTDEALQLRIDAKNPEEPGFIASTSMYVRRAKKADRENPCINIHDEGKVLLEAMSKWHAIRYPQNHFLFPGRSRNDDKSVSNQALTKSLSRLLSLGLIKRKLTSHGARAYYVTARRSWGIQDTQIAWEINQVGGVDTLRISYGGVPPSWLEGKGPKLTFLPEKAADYAWTKLFTKLSL